MLRTVVQAVANGLGYRIVPRARDPQTLMECVYREPIDVVVDVGASRGDTCIEWLKRYNNAHVYAFEPLPRTAALLRENTAEWAGRITIIQLAASDTKGEATFHDHVEHPSSSSLLASTTESAQLLPFTGRTTAVTVQTDMLDNALSHLVGKDSACLLKLDVQGHELSVLKGAAGLLRQARFVLAEINLVPLYDGQARFADILDYLRGHGMDFVGFVEQFHLEDGRALFADALFRKM